MTIKHRLSKRQGALLLLGVILLGTGFMVSPDSSRALFAENNTMIVPISPERDRIPTEEPASEPESQAPQPPAPDPLVSYEIRQGDTLSQIFENNGIPLGTLHQLLEADAEFLSLETLHPGTELRFRFNDQETLQQLTLNLDPARQVLFDRQPDGSFVHRQVEAETYWTYAVSTGEIERNFYQAGAATGLSEQQVDELRRLLKRKVDFRRDIRKGDPFHVLIAREMMDDQSTGHYRIEAVSLSTGGHTTEAFLYSDGNYYDRAGESILPAFRRWPTAQHYRVSSPFNPGRLHPVTGRVSPHNGVDLATPVGTSVMSTGDGVVARVGDHPYAGNYVDIRHNGSRSTRYLHLSRVLVKKGQRIRRGQEIARSGNTGRSTGPHLHFEFRISGNPVDPLTVDIPTAAKVPNDALAEFRTLVERRLALMQTESGSMPSLAELRSDSSEETGG